MGRSMRAAARVSAIAAVRYAVPVFKAVARRSTTGRTVSAVIAAGAMGTATAVGSRAYCTGGNTVRFGMCQIMVSEDKQENIATAKKAIADSAAQGSQIVCLPEIWNGPYAATSFPLYAEPIPATAGELTEQSNPSTYMMAQAARENKVYLIGGSISERDAEGKIYNTCVAFDPEGEIIAKHRKVHLFDIDIPGKITFRESETLTAGDAITIFESPWGKVGIGICYDMRFAEQALLMRAEGCKLLVYPGAFNQTTGPLHWELLARARAVDNQLYVAAISQARNPRAGYQAWGHSSVVGPWADVIAAVKDQPCITYADLDMTKVEEVRKGIPIGGQLRKDLINPVSAAAIKTISRM